MKLLGIFLGAPICGALLAVVSAVLMAPAILLYAGLRWAIGW